MSGDAGRLVLLDTSVVVHLARDSETGKSIEAEYHLSRRKERPLISTVVEGEMLGLARLWGWGERRLQDLRELLSQFVRVDAGLPEIVEAYSLLHAEGTRDGHPRGENDLWIAATANVLGAGLLTLDRDFCWLDPGHVRVLLVDEVP